MFYPTAKIIADSVNQSGDRLTTFVLTYQKLPTNECMTVIDRVDFVGGYWRQEQC